MVRLKKLAHCAPLFALLGAAFIGMSPIFVRHISNGPFTAGFYRFFFALPFIVVWAFFERRSIDRHEVERMNFTAILLVIMSGSAFAFDVALWNHSLEFTKVVNSSLFNNFTAFFVPIYMWILFSEKPMMGFVIAALFGVVGSYFLAGGNLDINPDSIKGDLIALLSAACFSFYIIGIKILRKKYPAASVMLGSTAVSATVIGVIAWWHGEAFMPPVWSDWLILIGYASLVHVFGQGLLAFAMSHVSATFSSVIGLIGPVVAGLLAWIFFSESMSPLQFLGCAIVLMSILFIQLTEKKKLQSS